MSAPQSPAPDDGWRFADELLPRCTFAVAGSAVTVACSGGPDSAALLALAVRAGLDVTAAHVDHGIRPRSADDAAVARRLAERLGTGFELHRAHLDDGPNLEARARNARRHLLGPGALTGHTADDQAETVLLALLRGAGATGLGGMRPGPEHPILGLRRRDTHELCRRLGLEVATDPTNRDPRFRRNRVRDEVLPLLDDVADRDVRVLLDRTAALLRDDDDLLDQLATDIDPTDVAALRAAPRPLARRALRRLLRHDGYAPDAAALDRVFDVVHHRAVACEVAGGRRITRRAGRLHLHEPPEGT